MYRLTIELSNKEFDYLYEKTKSKGYFEKAGSIFANAPVYHLEQFDDKPMLDKNRTKVKYDTSIKPKK